jgi:hypothetical protein
MVAIPQIVTEDRASGAQIIDGSLKFVQSIKTYLKRTPGSAGNRRTWTYSAWIIRGDQASSERGLFSTFGSSHPTTALKFGSSQVLEFLDYQSGYICQKITNQVFRDTSWYHIVIAIDTTLTTAEDRFKLYVNGERVTSFGTSTNVSSQNQELDWNSATEHNLFMHGDENTPYDGMGAQTYFIDGAALEPESFGFTDPLTNTWRPKKYNHRTDLYGVTWSSALVGDASGFQSAALAADGFDGEVGSSDNQYAQNNTGSNPSTITFTPVGGIKFNSSIQVYLINADNTVNVNGEGAQTIAANQWVTVKTGSGTLSTLVFSRASTSGASFSAIRVDGHILIDAQNDNSFYLPLDGNSPIGQDKSGNGNNWTPVNFGGSVALDNPIVSGALPILNTTQGGTQAAVGVRTDAYAQGDPNNPLSRNYSINTTATGGFSGSYPKTNLFDGQSPSDSNRAEAASNDDPINITFDPPITVSSTISLWSGKSSTRYQINDSGSYTTYSDAVGSYKDISHSGSLSNIKILHGSGGQAAGISAIKIDGTQLIDSVGLVLALPLVGSNADVSNSINSTSTTKVMTNVGNAAASFAVSNFYTGSFEFDGSGDGITCPDNTDFEFGSGDFTVECWAKQNSTSGFDVFVGKYGGSSDGEFILGKNANTPTFYWQDSSGNANINATNFRGNTSDWYHIAGVREGDVFTLYVNGICENSTTDATTIKTTSNKLTIGIENDESSSAFDGYLQDVRIYKGVAKYSGTTVGTQYFIPPATNPDILPDTPSGVSGGSKLAKITDGAVAFDGTNDYLSVADSSDLELGDSDFTIEGYYYISSLSAIRSLYAKRANSSSYGTSWYVSTNGSIAIALSTDGSDWTLDSSSSAGVVVTNKWHHLAVTRSGTSVKQFVDGVEVDSGTLSGSIHDNSSAVTIGVSGEDESFDFSGFMSNVRVIKGTALYTTNFTPPSAPLTNVTNTKLLCCQSNRTSGAAAVSPNISGVNDGTVWSSLVTGPTRKEDRVANAFNGSTSSPGAIAAYPGTLTFAPGLTGLTSVRIYGYHAGSGVTLHVNGAAQSPSSGQSFDITISTSTLDSIVWTATDGFNYMRLDAVVVDGTTLIDPVVGPDDSNEAATNFNPFNTDINTVRGQESGYATWNLLNGPSNVTYSDGNLFGSQSGTDTKPITATLASPSGKYYCEIIWVSGSYFRAGIQNVDVLSSDFGGDANGIRWTNAGDVAGGGGTIYDSTVSTYAVHDVLGIAWDNDNGRFYVSKNGVWQGGYDPSHSTTPLASYTAGLPFTAACTTGTNAITFKANFGQKPFKFSPPDGFQPLNLASTRPENVIVRPDQFIGAKTFAIPSGGSGGSVTLDNDFDMVWTKNTTNDSTNHVLQDSVRGYGDNKNLHPNLTVAQTSTNNITAVNGRTLTIGSNTNYYDNNVAWSWRAGGSKNTFNVDDVGYASASDVGMNVGGQNDNTFNTDVVWSDHITPSDTANKTRGFNGNTSDPVFDNGSLSSGQYITFTPPTPIAYTKSVAIYTGGVSGMTYQFNGGSATSIDASARTVIATGSGTFTSFALTRNTTTVHGWAAIEIDGKILLDNGVTPASDYPSIASVACSVGTKQGFSIIQYQGNGSRDQSIAHGLTQAPDFSIIKNMDGTNNWVVFHRSVTTTNQKVFYLNTTGAVADYSNGSYTWWHLLPDATVFYIGDTGTAINNGSNDMISYHWHDVPGLQKFGSFEGNGSADGPFVELGFKPAVVILKNVDNYGTGYDWFMFDNQRDESNPCSNVLLTNSSDNASSSNSIDFLSNGFKLRATTNGINLNAHTIVYAAWAEVPTANLFGGQSNAR